MALREFLQRNRQALLVWSILALILLVGGALRFNKLTWDEGQSFHPDERAIIDDYSSQGGVIRLMTVALTGQCGDQFPPRKQVDFPPGGLSFFIPGAGSSITAVGCNQPVPPEAINFWNATYSPLNPHFFAYGSFPMYLIKFGGWLAGTFSGENWNSYEKLMLVGRFLSVLFSLGTILLTFLIGRRVFAPSLGQRAGDAIGLVAAAFLAVSVLDIQLAHFLTFDVPLTFFITLTIFVAIGHMRNGTRWSAIRMGIAFGAALGCKFSSAPLALVIFVAILFYGLYGAARNSGEGWGKIAFRSWPDEQARFGNVGLGPRLVWRSLVNLILAGVATLATWFVVMPYAFIDFGQWIKRVGMESGMTRGEDSFPYTRQYVGSVPMLFQWGNLIQWGLSIPLGLLALAGLLYSFWQVLGLNRATEHPLTRTGMVGQVGQVGQPWLPQSTRRGAVAGQMRLKAEILLLCWLLPYMVIVFTFQAKFNRYMLPFLPVLLILAARLIITGAMTVRGRSAARLNKTTKDAEERRGIFKSKIQNLQSKIWAVVGVFVFAWAAIYAISFSSIYNIQHSRVAASEWIYNNIPTGATISGEWWDETLPVALVAEKQSNRLKQLGYPNRYTQLMLDIYGDRPNDVTIDYFSQQLPKLDYIILASNRLYATMPKLPWRYPVQTHYYEMLFDGRLGFEKVGEFTSYPTVPLLGWQLNDDTADESFSVYDHPKVLIFKKKTVLNEAQYQGLFEPVLNAPWIVTRNPKPSDLPTSVVKTGDGALEATGSAQRRDILPVCIGTKDTICTPASKGQEQPGKSLLLDKPVDQQPVIDDFKWNGFGSNNHWFAILVWFVMVQVLGLIGLPIAMRAGRRLPDGGYILAKPIGAAFVALIIWLIVSTRLWQNTVATNYTGLLIAAAFSGWLAWRYREIIADWFSQNRKVVIIEEAVFLFGFALFIFIRYLNPDLWHPYFGGEKPMEMTHIQGILKSAYFPPYDPWFSDGYINYYYYGQYLVATWIKLTGIDVAVAFNLAIPVMFGFVVAGAFSLTYNLAMAFKKRQVRLAGQELDHISRKGPILAGLFGVFMFGLAANLDGVAQILLRDKGFVEWVNNLKVYPVRAEVVRNFDYFRSSRVIPNTVDEFPFFSFLYADLHAHVIALPYTLVLLTLALSLISVNWAGYDDSGYSWPLRQLKRLWFMLDKTLITLLVAAMIIGLIGATNIWDLPTYSAMLAVAAFFGLARKPHVTVWNEAQEENLRPRLQPFALIVNLILAAALTGAVVVGAFTLYANFFNNYQALFSSIKTSKYFTEFGQFAFIFALPLFLIVSYLIWNWGRWLNWRRNPAPITGAPSNYVKEPPAQEADNEMDEPLPNPLEEQAVGGRSVARLESTTEDTAERTGIFKSEVQNPRPEINSVLSPQSLVLKNSSIQNFALAGADGSNYGTSFGSGGFGGNGGGDNVPAEQPRFSLNFYSLPWLLLIIFSGLAMLGTWVSGSRWALLATMVFLALAGLTLIIGRAFDPNPQQAAEARTPFDLFARLMIVGAFCIAGGTEIIIIADNLADSPYERMNTIFKFYYQVWTLFAIAGAYFAFVLWTRWIAPRLDNSVITRRYTVWRRSGRLLWVGALWLLCGCVSAYMFMATPSRVAERAADTLPPPTLDGLAFFDNMRSVTGMQAMSPGKVFDFTYEAQSFREFYSKLSGTPVVLQPSIFPYRGGGNWVAINTGLPTVLGWDNHERQQRYPEMVTLRSADAAMNGTIREIYNTGDVKRALDLLRHYHVTYIHMGVIEREGEVWDFSGKTEGGLCRFGRADYNGQCYEPLMSDAGYNKFERMVKNGYFEVVYQNPGVSVMKLTAKGYAGVVTEGDSTTPPPAPGTDLGNSDPRLARLLDTIKRSPNDFQAHYDLGQYYRQRRELAKAVEQFQITVRLRPKEVNPYHVLGDVYAEMGDFNLALNTYKQATAQAPTVAAAWNKYAMALLQVGQFDEAIANFNQTLKVESKFVEAAYHIGEVYEAQGKINEARAAYQRTISDAPEANNFWATRAREKLAGLK